MSGATPTGGIRKDMSQTSEVHLIVKCGQKTVAFFPERMKQTGRTVGKCIRYQGKWMSPNEFESVAGVPAKKVETEHKI